MSDYDYDQDVAPPPSDFAARLTAAIADLEEAEEELRTVGERSKELTEAVRTLLESTIPEILAEARLSEAKTGDGTTVKVKKVIRASLPGAKDHAERRAAAMAWLDATAPSIIKRRLEVDVGRDKSLANDITWQIQAFHKDIPVERVEEVNANTLAAWVREYMAKGGDVPDGTLNIHRQTIAEVKRPKAGR